MIKREQREKREKDEEEERQTKRKKNMGRIKSVWGFQHLLINKEIKLVEEDKNIEDEDETTI